MNGKFLLLASVFVVVGLSLQSVSAQWLDGWDYCINLTMDHDVVQSDQTNFPVTAFMNCSIMTCGGVQSAGEDIRVVNAGCGDGGSVIDYEIDYWNTTGVSPVTYNVSTLSSSSATIYSIYYGNSSVSDAQNPSGVWDSDFVGRYDMHSEGTTLPDSTNNNNLTKSYSDDPEILTGAIGMATNYDGGSPTDGATNSSGGPWPAETANMTYEMYVYANAISQYDRFFARAGDGTGGTILAVDTGGIINYIVDDSGGVRVKTSSYTLSATTWTYLAATRESTTYLIYGDGVSQSTAAGADWFVNTNNATSIGAQITSHTAFDGMIDEFRVSRIARPAAWINTTYYSLTNQMITYGVEQSEPGGGGGGDIVDITLNIPTDSSTNGSRTIQHSFTVDLIDSSLFGCWLRTPEGETFNTTPVNNGSATYITEVYGSDGSKSWTVTCQNETTNTTATNFTFTVETGTPYMIAYDDYNITTIPSEDGILSILYADVNNDFIREYLWAPVTDTNGNKDVYITTPAGSDVKVWDNGVDGSFNEYMQFFRTDIARDGTYDVLFGADIVAANHVFLEINDSNDVVQSSELDTSGASGSDHPKPIVADDWVSGDNGSDEYISGFCNSGEIICMDGNWTDGFSVSQIGDYSSTTEDFMGEDIDGDGDLEVFVAEGWTSGDATVTINIHTLFIDTDCSIATDKTAITNTSYSMAYFCDGVVDLDDDGNDELAIVWQNDVTNYVDILAYEYDSEGNLTYDFTIGSRISDVEHISWNAWCGDHDLDSDNELVMATRDRSDGITLTARMYDCPSGSCTTTTLYSGTEHSIVDIYGRSPFMRYYDNHPSGTFAFSGFLDDWVAWKINYTLPFIERIETNYTDSINITYTAFDSATNSTPLMVYREFYCNYTLDYSDSLVASNASEYTWEVPSSYTSPGDICWGRFWVDDGYSNSTVHNSTTIVISSQDTPAYSETYGTEAYETTDINISVSFTDLAEANVDSVMAYLIWNGTNETYDSMSIGVDSYNFTATVSIPLLDANETVISFYWDYVVTYDDASTVSLSTDSHNQTLLYGYWIVSSTYSETNFIEGEDLTVTVVTNSEGDADLSILFFFQDEGDSMTESSGTFTETVNTTAVGDSVYNYTGVTVVSMNVTYGGESRIENTTTNITVFKIVITNCSGFITLETLHFYIKDEEDDSAVTGDLDITLEAWAATDMSRTYSWGLTGANNYSLCIYPNWSGYTVDSMMQYEATGYDPRTHYLAEASITNTTQDIDLYLQSNTSTSLITMQVLNSLGLPEEDVYIYVARYYIDTDTYTTIAILNTDFDGKAYTYLTKNTVWYRFTLIQDGEVLEQYSPTIVTEDTLTFQLTQQRTSEYFEYYDSLAWNCTWPGNTTTCTVMDTSGLMASANLKVWRWSSLGYIDLCDTEDTGSSVTLVCPMGSLTGYIFYYSLSATFQESTSVLESGFINHLGTSNIYGNMGVFVALIVLLVLTFIGVAVSWEVGILGAASATLLSLLGGFLIISYTSVFSVFILGGIAIYKYKRR